ncbi:MAG: T9SS type A sorting domain-containing protein [Bacteroidia bacterium]
MKTYTSLLIPVLLITLKCSAQNLDANGVPLSATDVNNNIPYLQTPSMSPFVYDSSRMMTEINVSGSADAYPWLSADGLRLYYYSGVFNNIAFTSRANTASYFDPPVLANIVFPMGTLSCWFSADELDVYYLHNGLYYAHRTSIASAFGPAVAITVTGVAPYSACSLDPTQNELYFFVNNSIKRCDRTGPTSFNYVYSLTSPTGWFNPGQISKDGLVFFAGVPGPLKSDIFSLERTAIGSNFSNPQPVQGINIPGNPYTSQPTMSDNLEWAVVLSNVVDSWSEDELAIAHNGTTTSVFDPAKENFKPMVYPNPVADRLRFRMSKAAGNKPVLEIYSAQNTLIEKQLIDANESIDVSHYAYGVYFYKIYTAGNTAVHSGKFAVMH